MKPSEIVLPIGGVYASRQPMVVKTLLGSCIAVCLHDRVASVGGMNHFMLPSGGGAGEDAGRFGVHAMDLLIGAIMKAGGDRRRFGAKVFGGANVLDIGGTTGDIGRQNIEFIQAFLRDEGIPLLNSDVGGHVARQVHFHTKTGRAFVKRVPRVRPDLLAEERKQRSAPAAYGRITLFE